MAPGLVPVVLVASRPVDSRTLLVVPLVPLVGRELLTPLARTVAPGEPVVVTPRRAPAGTVALAVRSAAEAVVVGAATLRQVPVVQVLLATSSWRHGDALL